MAYLSVHAESPASTAPRSTHFGRRSGRAMWALRCIFARIAAGRPIFGQPQRIRVIAKMPKRTRLTPMA